MKKIKVINRPLIKAHCKSDLFGRALEVLELLVNGFYKCEIKRAFVEKYGVTYYEVENYIRKARLVLNAYLKESIEDHKANSLGFYRSILRNPMSTPKDKLIAHQRIDRILGIEPGPITVSLSSPVSNPFDGIRKAADKIDLDPENWSKLYNLVNHGSHSNGTGKGSLNGDSKPDPFSFDDN